MRNPHTPYGRAVAIPVIAMLFIYLAGSLYFYKERMLFSDAAHIAFLIINTGSLQIQEDRYGSFITQLFPWAAAHLHLPLKAVLMAYSASFVLVFMAVSVLLYRMRQYALLALLGCYCTLLNGPTWYWTNNELHAGIAWLLVAFSWLFYSTERGRNPWLTALLFLPLMYIAIMTHPLVMTTAAFLWVYYLIALRPGKTSPVAAIIFTLLLAAIIYFKVQSSRQQWYDSSIMAGLFPLKTAKMIDAFGSTVGQEFLSRCGKRFWLMSLLFVAGIVHLAYRKRYLVIALTCGGIIVYYLLMCLTYHDYVAFIIESEWMPLVLIACLPFAFYLLPHIRPARVAALLAVVFFIRILYTAAAAPDYTHRIALTKKILDRMQQQGITKLVLTPDKRLDDTLLMSWGMPAETMMLSALERRKPQCTAVVRSAQELPKGFQQDDRTMISTFEMLSPGQINHGYFQPDTTQPYRVMSYEDFMK